MHVVIEGDAGTKMYKLVIHRENGGLQIVPHSSRDMPYDGYTIVKALTAELATELARLIHEFIGESVTVIMNPIWLKDRAFSMVTYHIVPVFSTVHDEQQAANTLLTWTATEEGAGEIVRVAHITWPHINHTFESVLLMVAPSKV